jgi:hypothetical protein
MIASAPVLSENLHQISRGTDRAINAAAPLTTPPEGGATMAANGLYHGGYHAR